MKKREHRLAFIPHLKEVGIPACGRKRYCCRYFNYGSGLPIWDIEVFQHENGRWKIVAKGIMKGPVFITAEDDACNNRIVFYKLDARIDTYTGEIKSLTKGKEIGELSLSDLLPTNSK